MYGVEFRPLTFKSVYGLDIIKDILKALLKSGKYDPAYLFTGSFSSGKTTLARIFSRSILCGNLQSDMSPCNKCPSCKSFLQNKHPGYTEIDAANSGTKDKIQDLKESLTYEPVSGHRIILFDEAHNISKEGKDALLKLLEQMSNNIVIIFCTTESEKMPDTIKSRCMEFQLNDPNEEDVVKKLVKICTIKKFEYDKDGLYDIVRSTGRHYRDAENKLRQVSLLGGLTKENVKRVVINYDEEIAYMLCVLSYDLNKTMELASHISSRMNISDIYATILRIINDSIKHMNGVHFNKSYEELVEAVSKQHGKSLFEMLDYIVSKNRLTDATLFVSDLLVLHYKFLKDSFSPKNVEVPSSNVSKPSKDLVTDPVLQKIKEAEKLPPWRRDEMLRTLKKSQTETKDERVREKVSDVWGPDKKRPPQDLRKRDITQKKFVEIVGDGFDGEKI